MARSESIRGAATALGLAQPNLSQQLKRIEERFSAPLFERSPTGVHPTGYGRAVLERAAEIIDSIETLGDVRPESVLRHRFFDLDVSTAIGGGSGMPGRPVWESGPALPAEGIAAVLQGSADIFVGVHWPHTPWPDFLGLASVNLFSHDMTVLVRDDHPLVGHGADPVPLARLRDEQWVTRNSPHTTELECGRFGFSPAVRSTTDADARRRLLVGGAVTFFNPRSSVPPGFRTLRYTDASTIHHLMHYHQDRVTWNEADAVVTAVRERCVTAVGHPTLLVA